MNEPLLDLHGIIPTVFHYDTLTDEVIVERIQPDVEPVMDRCRALQAAGWDGYNADRSMKAIAEIPIAVAEQWLKEGVDILNPGHNAEVMKRLRDPALAGFRLDSGSRNARGANIIVNGLR